MDGGFGPVPREVMDMVGKHLATAWDELRTFRAAPPGWAAAAEAVNRQAAGG